MCARVCVCERDGKLIGRGTERKASVVSFPFLFAACPTMNKCQCIIVLWIK